MLRRLFLSTFIACWWLASAPDRGLAAEGRTGEQIYRQQCVSCHGAKGEGTVDNHPEPLVGDKSIAQLAKLIARTMPKDAPKKCTGEDAGKVAAYIYDAFYSKTAQVRNKPARIELSRLTVRQYRNAVTDLLGSFGTAGRWDDTHGLRGEYFKGRRFRNADRVFERVDPEIRFDFGTASPEPQQIVTVHTPRTSEGADSWAK